MPHEKSKTPILDVISRIIFETRWGLVPIYLLMMVGVAAYVVKFTQETFVMAFGVWHWDAEHLLLAVLAMVDMSMVANFIVMTIKGGFSTFVSEFNQHKYPNRPRWMNGLDSTTLKIQMGKSLIGVTSVHLLTTFMRLPQLVEEAHGRPLTEVNYEIIIHLTFLLTTIGYCYISKLTHGHKAAPVAGDDDSH